MTTLGNTPVDQTVLALEARKSFALGVQLKHKSDATPVDLTGASVRFVVAQPQYKGGAPIVTRNADILDAALGLCQVSLQALDLNLGEAEYPFALTLQPASGYSTLILKGVIDLRDNADPATDGTFVGVNPTTNVAAYLEDGGQVTVEISSLDGMSTVAQDAADRAKTNADAAAASATNAANSAAQAQAQVFGGTDPDVALVLNDAASDSHAAAVSIVDSRTLANDNDPASALRAQMDARLEALYAHKDALVLNLKDYGAKGDGVTDDTAAVQAWLNDVVAKQRRGYAPAGAYVLTNRVYVGPNLSEKKFALVGAGPRATKFLVRNNVGGFTLDNLSGSRGTQVEVADFTVTADGISGVGTGFEYLFSHGGSAHARSLWMTNFEISGTDLTKDCFKVGINLQSVFRPLLTSVTVQGPFGPGVSGNMDDTSPGYFADKGIDISDCYGWEIRDSFIWSAKTGLYDHGTDAEGGTFVHSVIDSCKVGVDYLRTSREPGVKFVESHFDCRDWNVKLEGTRLPVIRGCLFYNVDQSARPTPARDIWLRNAEEATITDNTFHYLGGYQRINIDLDDTSAMASPVIRKILVGRNIFNTGYTAGTQIGTATCVKIGPTATAPIVLDGNYYTDSTLPKHVDDQSKKATIFRPSASSQGVWTFESQEDGGAATPLMVRLYRNSGTPANADRLAALQFMGKGADATDVEYGLVEAIIADATAKTGALRFWAMIGGVQTRVAHFESAPTASSTGMWLLCNNGSTTTLQRVVLGAADSAGVGYRYLRVPN